MNTITINSVGDQCPLPVIKTKNAIAAMSEPGFVEVHVDNEIAVQNLEKFARSKGLSVSAEKLERQHYKITITVNAAEPAAPKTVGDEDMVCLPDRRGKCVVAIASECMGSGDDKLGAALMKGFIYALSEQDELPATIIFYNGGAKLTAIGSGSVEDLLGLEAQGVEIITCGACANYYGLEGKQAVGTVSNMYEIAEKLTLAERVVRP